MTTTTAAATLSLTVNGETRQVVAPATVASLLAALGIDRRKVAVERNLEIVPRSAYETTTLADGDRIEIVHFIGGGDVASPEAVEDTWEVAGRTFRSRLIVGTGRYRDLAETAAAIEASGAEIVTVAVRRVNLSDPSAPMLQDFVSPSRYTYLPNTAGCHTAEEAVRTARLARELLDGQALVKLEVLADPETLLPEPIETLRACEILVREGFEVMVYTNDDPVLAKRLEELGCVAVMPLAAPIG
ncbi:MAG: sulfur carrier protein ThiS, partial [Elioraea sp.]|nr:sulfur carrier protein ThiS [Elioraea sp.]